MYKIVGADKKEYGPVTAMQLHQWISEGRANAQTLIQAEGSADWRPLGSFSEFAASLQLHAEPLPSSATPPAPELTLDEIQAGDYELDIMGCVSRAFELFKANMGRLVGGFVIVAALGLVANFVVGLILQQFVSEPATHTTGFLMVSGLLSLVASALVKAPLLGGFYLVILKTIRGQLTSTDEVFSGFQKGFSQFVLAYFAVNLLAGLFFIPFDIVYVARILPIQTQIQNATPDAVWDLVAKLFHTGLGTAPQFLIGAIPALYLSTCLLFTLPLIADKNLTFGTAMKVSWKMVHKHWWLLFGLVVLMGLLNVAGLFCCLIGLLFTFPIGLTASMFAYETVFSARRSKTD